MPRIQVGDSGTATATWSSSHPAIRLGYTYDPTNTFRGYNEDLFARNITRHIGDNIRTEAGDLFDLMLKEHRLHRGKVDSFKELAYNIAYSAFFALYRMGEGKVRVDEDTVGMIVFKSLRKGGLKWESLFAVNKPDDNIYTLTEELLRVFKVSLSPVRIHCMYEQIRKGMEYAVAHSSNTLSHTAQEYIIRGCDKDGNLIWYNFDELSEDVALQVKVGLTAYLRLLGRVYSIWYDEDSYQKMASIAKNGTPTELLEFVIRHRVTTFDVIDYIHSDKDLANIICNAVGRIEAWRCEGLSPVDILGGEPTVEPLTVDTLFGIDNNCVAKDLESTILGKYGKDSYEYHMRGVFSKILATSGGYTFTIHTSEGDVVVENPVFVLSFVSGVNKVLYINDKLPDNYYNKFSEEYKSDACIIIRGRFGILG